MPGTDKEQGIGKACALAAAKKGANVVIADLCVKRAESTES
jgi:NAD(P)-dependent dehydrogenase (short-subunit alcohol dehydrogenase family)